MDVKKFKKAYELLPTKQKPLVLIVPDAMWKAVREWGGWNSDEAMNKQGYYKAKNNDS